jgi:CBS domain-containing protein
LQKGTDMQQWRVRDVMTDQVVTATGDTSVGEVTNLLTTHRISAVPIVGDDNRVMGVVSEADLLPKVAAWGSPAGRPARRRRAGKASAGTAQELMNTRPVTIAADAPLAAAAKKMQAKKVKRLLVTGDTGRLQGIVSRADLLRPFTRSDAAIRHDVVTDVLRRTMWITSDEVQVQVRDGMVTLTGAVGRRTTAAIIARLTAALPGVAAVTNNIHYDFDDTAIARSRTNRTHPFSAEPFRP